MRSIERKYEIISQKKPLWSSLVCFAETIKGRRLNRQTIRRWFHRLVEKDDYERSEKRELLLWLEDLSNTHEEDKILGATASLEGFFMKGDKTPVRDIKS